MFWSLSNRLYENLKFNVAIAFPRAQYSEDSNEITYSRCKDIYSDENFNQKYKKQERITI